MDFNLPFGYPIETYFWVVGLACVAGIVKYINNAASEKSFSFLILLKDMLTGGLSGVMAFWLCEAVNISSPMNAVIITITGVMGSRAWDEFESILKGLVQLHTNRIKNPNMNNNIHIHYDNKNNNPVTSRREHESEEHEDTVSHNAEKFEE